MVFRNGGVCALFFQPLINTNFTKIFFSRPNLKERMSFRDGIIFKISSPHTEKIYIGCSSLPLNRERKEENARSRRQRCRREKKRRNFGELLRDRNHLGATLKARQRRWQKSEEGGSDASDASSATTRHPTSSSVS